jgi:chromosome segregation ATPase
MNNENEQLKSVVTSYRLKEDTKDKIKQQLDSLGLTQEQYFNKVVSLMEVENVKKNSFLSKDTTLIQQSLDTILKAFIDIAEDSNKFISNKDAELQTEKAKYKDMLLNKDNSITELKQELQNVYTDLDVLQNDNEEHKNELLSIKVECNKQLEQLESNLADKTTLINEYKTKNDDLLGIVSEYKQYKSEVEEYKKLLSDAQAKNISLNDDIKNKELSINELTKIIEKLKQDNIEDLESIKEKLNIEKDKEILNLRQVQQQEIEKLQDKHNKENEKHNAEYKALLDKIEKERAAAHTKASLIDKPKK